MCRSEHLSPCCSPSPPCVLCVQCLSSSSIAGRDAVTPQPPFTAEKLFCPSHVAEGRAGDADSHAGGGLQLALCAWSHVGLPVVMGLSMGCTHCWGPQMDPSVPTAALPCSSLHSPGNVPSCLCALLAKCRDFSDSNILFF